MGGPINTPQDKQTANKWHTQNSKKPSSDKKGPTQLLSLWRRMRGELRLQEKSWGKEKGFLSKPEKFQSTALEKTRDIFQRTETNHDFDRGVDKTPAPIRTHLAGWKFNPRRKAWGPPPTEGGTMAGRPGGGPWPGRRGAGPGGPGERGAPTGKGFVEFRAD